jgi:hypothetical protein
VPLVLDDRLSAARVANVPVGELLRGYPQKACAGLDVGRLDPDVAFFRPGTASAALEAIKGKPLGVPRSLIVKYHGS